MSNIELFHTPGACSTVSLIALEKTGIEYSDRALNMFKGEHKSPEYLKINPKGKVPALRIGDEILTENASILIYLTNTHPSAKLLPGEPGSVKRAQAISTLLFCSSTLHIAARGTFKPEFYSESAPESVRETARKTLAGLAKDIEASLTSDWWLGDEWSIADNYLFWAMGVGHRGGVSFETFPNIVAHSERVRQLPQYKSAISRMEASNKAAGIELPPGMSLDNGLS